MLTAVAVVAAMQIVGILLVAAMMVLPVASAQLLARSFRASLALSVAIGVAASVAGLARLGVVGTRARRHDRAGRRRPSSWSSRSSHGLGAHARHEATRRPTHEAPGAAELHAAVAERLRASASATRRSARPSSSPSSGAGKPLSTAEIVESRTGPQSSVYRNLSVLEHAGVVRRVITEGGFARFELAEELTEHHHHLICSTLRPVEDVTIPPDLETTMDRTVDRLAKRSGFARVRPPARPDRHVSLMRGSDPGGQGVR